jgi:hypothetical protein
MEQQILVELSRHVTTMRVTCWLELLSNKADLTSWISTVACDHRKVLQIFDFGGGFDVAFITS